MITIKLKSVALSLSLWGLSLLFLLHYNWKHVEGVLVDSLSSKALAIDQLLDVSIAYTVSTQRQLENALRLAAPPLRHPLSQKLRDYSEWNGYGLSGNEKINGIDYLANLTGIGRLQDIDDEVLLEIDAILGVDLSAPFSEAEHSFIWSYYQSRHGFLLLSPSIEPDVFHLKPEHFDSPYWQIALPENNAEKQTVISELYDDGAGQGLMVSISTPVYVDDIFRGVTAVDVGLEHLKKIVLSTTNPFQLGINVVSRDGQPVLGKTTLFDVVEDGTSYQLNDIDQHFQIRSDRIHNAFYVYYEIGKVEFWLIVLRQSFLAILVLSLLIVNFYLLSRLYYAFAHAKELSMFDRLSQLYNRMTHEELSNEVFQTRSSENQAVSILMVDIDNFKMLNDAKGHHAGDRGIQKVAEVIKSMLRKTDMAGRFGGEEFVITMPDTDQNQAYSVAERIRKKVESEQIFEDAKITISIGVAESKSLDVYEYQALCKKADQALYAAKNKGRNRTEIFADEEQSGFE